MPATLMRTPMASVDPKLALDTVNGGPSVVTMTAVTAVSAVSLDGVLVDSCVCAAF